MNVSCVLRVQEKEDKNNPKVEGSLGFFFFFWLLFCAPWEQKKRSIHYSHVPPNPRSSRSFALLRKLSS